MNNCIALSSILLIISLAVSISKADIYDGCSLGINCIAVPRSDLGSGSDTEEKCVANKDCKMITSFYPMEDGIKFDVLAEYPGVDPKWTWVGIGLSVDGPKPPTQSMGNDAVVACYGTNVVHYWSTHTALPVIDNTQGLRERTVSVEDGKIQCSFIHDMVTEIVRPDDLGPITIDLENDAYYLQIAHGPITYAYEPVNGNIDKHVPDQYGHAAHVSSTALFAGNAK